MIQAMPISQRPWCGVKITSHQEVSVSLILAGSIYASHILFVRCKNLYIGITFLLKVPTLFGILSSLCTHTVYVMQSPRLNL